MLEKELEGKVKQDTQLIAEAQKEYTLKHKVKKVRGQILFAVFPAEEFRTERVKIISTAVIGVDKKVKNNHRAEFKEGAVYMYAINAARAAHKVKRELYRFILRQEAKKDFAKMQGVKDENGN